jgi:preprotein translocase subunit YajC
MISTILLFDMNPATMQQIAMFGLIFVVFYFFMIRPQIKKQKDQKKFVEDLKKGDKVVTTAGIHGHIAEINDTIVTINVDNNVKIRFEKSAISLEASKALNAAEKS